MDLNHRDPDHDAEAPSGIGAPAGLPESWRSRYQRSFTADVFRQLGEINFADRVLVFGASLLLSVLPLIIVLSAYASHRVEEDITHHLGLSGEGARIVDHLFKASVKSFNLAIFITLLLSFAGTIAVARSVEAIYERAFDQAPLAQMEALLRCTVWVVVVTAFVVADAAIGKSLRDEPAGPMILAVTELVGFTLFFWFSIHFLLAGRQPWRRLAPAAILTSALWVGLGIFAAFYFSSTLVSDSNTYGTIGVTFTLASWFVAMGAVLALGAVIGAVWQRRRHGVPPK
jgi:membrane protein